MVILLTLGCIWLVIAVLFFPFLCHMLSSDERAEDDLASIEYLRQWRREWRRQLSGEKPLAVTAPSSPAAAPLRDATKDAGLSRKPHLAQRVPRLPRSPSRVVAKRGRPAGVE